MSLLDHLRSLWNRPLRDASRYGLFVAATAIVVLAAGIMVLFGDGTAREGTRPEPSGVREQTEPSTEAFGPVVEPETTPPPEPTRREVAAIRQSAQAFVRGYLAWSYGHRRKPPGEGALRARLAAQPPDVPPSVRRLHPRVVALQAEQ